MAKINASIPRDLDWQFDDVIELYIGDENAADLVSSDPAGGVLVVSQSPWPEAVELGGWGDGEWGDFGWGLSAAGYQWGDEGSAWGYGGWGINLAPPALLEHIALPTDKCADLPVGVLMRDTNGNTSAVTETVAQISDPPRGARGVAVAGTGSPGEVSIDFTESPDV